MLKENGRKKTLVCSSNSWKEGKEGKERREHQENRCFVNFLLIHHDLFTCKPKKITISHVAWSLRMFAAGQHVCLRPADKDTSIIYLSLSLSLSFSLQCMVRVERERLRKCELKNGGWALSVSGFYFYFFTFGPIVLSFHVWRD